MSTARTLEALGGEGSLGRSPPSLERAVREGLPKAALVALAERYAADEVGRRRFIHGIVPRATWERRSILSPQASERVERLARLWALAVDVWSEEALARRFMTADHPELDGETPVEAAQTELGGRRVERILNSLLHGLPV